MDLVKILAEALHEKDLDVEDKCRIYCDLKTALDIFYTSGKAFEDAWAFRQILAIAKPDVSEGNLEDMQFLVLKMVDVLFKCKWKETVLVGIPEEYVQLAFDNLDECTNVQKIAQNIVQSCIQKLITREVYDVENEFLRLDNQEKMMKMIQFMDGACKDVSTTKRIHFYYENIISVLFRTNNVDLRTVVLKYAQQLLPRYPIQLLGSTKLDIFKDKVKNVYVPQINALYENGDQIWDKLWKFIVQCCDKMMHSQVDIMNKLLKPVEFSFRNNVIQAKCIAYDCWMALITNFALDLDYFCMSKQMKLIMIPLQHVALKNKTVTKKRFEVWIHLLKALKGRYHKCLEPFLISCFGASDKPPSISFDLKNADIEKVELLQGYSLALLEILGHFDHQDGIICTGDLTYSVDIGQPVINAANFGSLSDLIFHSVGECTSWMIYLFDLRSVRRLVNCIWGSLFHSMKRLPREQQEDGLRNICNWLMLFVKEINNNLNYLYAILQPIFKLLMQKTFLPEDLCSLLIFLPIIKGFVEHNFLQGLSASFMETITILIQYGTTNNGKEVFSKELFKIFGNSNISHNFHSYMYFWNECSDRLVDLQQSLKMDISEIMDSVGTEYMIRPIHDLCQIADRNMSDKFFKQWGCIYLELYKISPKQASTIIEEIRNIACNSLEIAGNVCNLYKALNTSITINFFNDEYVFGILNLTLDLLKFEDATVIKAELLLDTVVSILGCMSQRNNVTSKNVEILCHCCSYMLKLYKIIDILDPFEKYVVLLPNNCREYIPFEIVNTLKSLKTSRDENILSKVNKILTILPNSTEKEKPALIKCIQKSRGEKITEMLKTPKTFGNTNVPSIDFNKPGVANTSSNSSNALNIDIDDETNFDLIDKEYTFELENLIEHQLEKLDELNFDIPALDPDLSQNQSNSQPVLEKYFETTERDNIKAKNNTNDEINTTETDDTNSQETSTEIKEKNESKDQKEITKNKQTITNKIETIEKKENKFEDEFDDLKDNFQIESSTVEQIEAIITNDFENDDLKETIDDEDKYVVNLLKKEKLLQKELNKIRMDLVGGDLFIQNLDIWNNKIRTRHRLELKNTTKKSLSSRSRSLDANKQNNNNSNCNQGKSKISNKLSITTQNDQVSPENVVLESTKRKRKTRQSMAQKCLKTYHEDDINQKENKKESPKKNTNDNSTTTNKSDNINQKGNKKVSPEKNSDDDNSKTTNVSDNINRKGNKKVSHEKKGDDDNSKSTNKSDNINQKGNKKLLPEKNNDDNSKTTNVSDKINRKGNKKISLEKKGDDDNSKTTSKSDNINRKGNKKLSSEKNSDDNSKTTNVSDNINRKGNKKLSPEKNNDDDNSKATNVSDNINRKGNKKLSPEKNNDDNNSKATNVSDNINRKGNKKLSPEKNNDDDNSKTTIVSDNINRKGNKKVSPKKNSDDDSSKTTNKSDNINQKGNKKVSSEKNNDENNSKTTNVSSDNINLKGNKKGSPEKNSDDDSSKTTNKSININQKGNKKVLPEKNSDDDNLETTISSDNINRKRNKKESTEKNGDDDNLETTISSDNINRKRNKKELTEKNSDDGNLETTIKSDSINRKRNKKVSTEKISDDGNLETTIQSDNINPKGNKKESTEKNNDDDNLITTNVSSDNINQKGSKKESTEKNSDDDNPKTTSVSDNINGKGNKKELSEKNSEDNISKTTDVSSDNINRKGNKKVSPEKNSDGDNSKTSNVSDNINRKRNKKESTEINCDNDNLETANLSSDNINRKGNKKESIKKNSDDDNSTTTNNVSSDNINQKGSKNVLPEKISDGDNSKTTNLSSDNINWKGNKTESPKKYSKDNTSKTASVLNSVDIIESSQDSVINIDVYKISSAKIRECVIGNEVGFPNITDKTKIGNLHNIENIETTETKTAAVVTNPNQTPGKTVDLPSSPVDGDTPLRTSELIRDTLDISPIMPELEMEPLYVRATGKENTQIATESENVSDKNQARDSGVDTKLEKLPILCSETPVSSHKENVFIPRLLLHSKTNRGMKMIKEVEKVQIENKENDSDTVDNAGTKKDYLQFIREIPSAMASPRYSILKRKATDVLDEELSPPRKQKRVSFPDPPLTCKKLYLKDDDEHHRFNVQNNTVDDLAFTSLPVNSNDDAVHVEEATEEAKKGEQAPSIEHKDVELELFATVVNKGGGTSALVEIRKEELPIYPSLVDCNESVIKILPLITGSQASLKVIEDLQKRNINTIGDLANMSKKNIQALNVHSVVTENIQAALGLYSDVINSKLKTQTTLENMPKLQLTSLPVTNHPSALRNLLEMKQSSQVLSVNGRRNIKLVNSISKMEERKKLQNILPTFIRDFEKMKQKAIQQGLRISSLCETIIEIVGPETFISILQDNKILSITDFLKNDNRNKLVREIIESMGLRNFLHCLCQMPEIPATTIIKIVYELMTSKVAKSRKESFLSCLFELVSLSSIVEHVGFCGIIRELHSMCKRERICKKSLFETLMSTFNPHIDDVVSSFRHINIVRVQDKTVCRSEFVQNDLNNFAKRILCIVDEPTCASISKDGKERLTDCSDLVNYSQLERASAENIVNTCLALMQQLNKKDELRPNFERMLLYMCDNISLSDIFQVFSTYFKADSK